MSSKKPQVRQNNSRFYYEGELSLNNEITLSKEEIHHAQKVMRLTKEDTIEIVNGKGALATAFFSPTPLIMNISYQEPPVEKNLLIQAFLEPSHLDTAIEKATEIGIDEIILFPATKSKLRVLSENRKSRLKKITVTALKQSKRLYLPKITIVTSLANLPPLPKNLYLAEPGAAPYSHSSGSRAITVGPESGFTREEVLTFKGLGFLPISLGPNILRAETASIVSSFLISRPS